jgi:hypothetical protein
MSNIDVAFGRAHNESSIFFSLPPELRNIVYEYALTNEQAVHTQINALGQPTLTLVSDQGLITEANLLTYVCWNLYAETRGLSLRFNNIVVKCQDSSPALAECVIFLHAVATKYHPFIRRIDLVEKSGLHPPITGLGKLRNILSGRKFSSIHGLCVRQPYTRVIIRLDIERTDFDTYRCFVISHAATSLYLRGHPGVSLIQNSTLVSLVLQEHYRQPRVLYKEKPGEILPENFRFVLMNSIEGMVDREEGIPELWFVQACQIHGNGC